MYVYTESRMVRETRRKLSSEEEMPVRQSSQIFASGDVDGANGGAAADGSGPLGDGNREDAVLQRGPDGVHVGVVRQPEAPPEPPPAALHAVPRVRPLLLLLAPLPADLQYVPVLHMDLHLLPPHPCRKRRRQTSEDGGILTRGMARFGPGMSARKMCASGVSRQSTKVRAMAVVSSRPRQAGSLSQPPPMTDGSHTSEKTGSKPRPPPPLHGINEVICAALLASYFFFFFFLFFCAVLSWAPAAMRGDASASSRGRSGGAAGTRVAVGGAG